MLSALGVPAAQEELFRVLLRHPRATVAELSAATGRSTEDCRDLLTRLAEVGLVTRGPTDPESFLAVPPDVAFRGLIRSRQAALQQAESELQGAGEDTERRRVAERDRRRWSAFLAIAEGESGSGA